MIHRTIALSLLMLAPLGARAAPAASPIGVWARDAGQTQVAISRCGASLCGRIKHLMPGSRAKLGQVVLYDMKPSGPATWTGNAINPDDGKRYTGKMSLVGGTLTVSGCVLGGLICDDVAWTKQR